MAHNPTVLTRKSKTSRTVYPSRSQQVTDNEPPKEKVPKMTGIRDVQSGRRAKVTNLISPDSATKIIVNDLHRLGVCQMGSPSKTQARAAGGGATSGQKYHRELPYTPSTPKSTRSAATTSTVQKLTPKESKVVREHTQFKDCKTSMEYKDIKEAKPYKEPKEPQPRGADRSPNLSHRHSRHQSNRTKNYFDKYLSFAFDLGTPEGVKQLEAHFFPNKDPTGAGTSTSREE